MPGSIATARPVLVAPGPLPGLRATEVAAAIGRGLEAAGLPPPDLMPLADGGPGTLEVLLTALGGEITGAVVGDGLAASVALLEDGGTALVEVAPGMGDAAAGELAAAAAATGAAVVVVAAADTPFEGTGTRDDAAAATAGLRRRHTATGDDAAAATAGLRRRRTATGDGGAAAAAALHAGGGLRGARLVVLCPGAPGPVAGALATAHRARLEPGAGFVLEALDADARMRAARAVIGGTARLEHASLRGLFGELGTRARQSGVPFHAVVAEDALDPFGKRILDLQRVLVTTTAPALEAAAEALGRDLATGAA